MERNPFLTRLGRAIFFVVCAAGVVSGGFLLLCRGGVLDPAGFSGADPVEAVSAPAEIPAEAGLPTRSVFVSMEEIRQRVELPTGGSGGPDGGTALVVTMKAGDGSLGYVSRLALAAELGTSSGDPAANAALVALNRTPGLHTVALVSCLRDGSAVGADGFALERVSGSPWLDETATGWLDPAQPPVQDYLIGVCRELAQLGFDEILLTHCAYPTGGDQTSLALGTENGKAAGDRETTLETFCRRLQGALADWPVLLSVAGEADGGTADPQSGQGAGLLATFARVWAAEEDADALAAFHPVTLPEE